MSAVKFIRLAAPLNVDIASLLSLQ